MKTPTQGASRKFTQAALEWLSSQPLQTQWTVSYHRDREAIFRRFDDEESARDFAEKQRGGLRCGWIIPASREEIFSEIIIPSPSLPAVKKKHKGIHAEDRKWPRALARVVALELSERLSSVCERIEVAGSIRRGKRQVGDVELLIIPRCFFDRNKEGEVVPVPETDKLIERLETEGVLGRRLNSKGRTTVGAKNKLMVHVETAMAVDLFFTTPSCWWNALTCRTGGAETNKRLAQSAIANGRNWNVYGEGVTLSDGKVIRAESEEHVFELCGVPYLSPDQRL